jgi:DNA-binding transcriptional LysR family regulator
MIQYLDKISAHKCLILNTIIRQGSPAAAARTLGLPVSKIHNDIKSIEKAVGGPIMLRSQRKVVLTPLGEKIAEFARIVVDGIHVLEDEDQGKEQVTDLVVGCPNGFAEFYMPKILKEFHETCPQVSIHMHAGLEYMDFTSQDSDIVIGHHLDNRIDLTQNFLCDTTYRLYASKEYLEKAGVPKKISDLKNHQLLSFKLLEDGPNPIAFLNDTAPVATSNNLNSLLRMCELGMGISFLSTDILKLLNLHETTLVPILENEYSKTFKLYFLTRKFNKKSLIIDAFKAICFNIFHGVDQELSQKK